MPRPANPRLAQDLIRATAEVLEERGIDGFTVKAVAARVGYSPATVYLYFKNRNALLGAAVDRATDWFLAGIEEADRSFEGRERLRATSRAYVEWGVRNPALYRLIMEQRMPQPAVGEELQRRRRGLVIHQRMMAELLGAGRDVTLPKNAEVASDMVWVILHGIVSLAIAGRLFPLVSDDERVSRALALVDGMVDEWAEAWCLP